VIDPKSRWWSSSSNDEFLQPVEICCGGAILAPGNTCHIGLIIDCYPCKLKRCYTHFYFLQLDGGGCIFYSLLLLGYYDVQINGGFGIDFADISQVTLENMAEVSHKLLAHGVVAYLPTIISSSPDTYRKLIPKHNELRSMLNHKKYDVTDFENSVYLNKPRAKILGLHLEVSPFFFYTFVCVCVAKLQNVCHHRLSMFMLRITVLYKRVHI
jgi:hypothetical protein